MKGPQMKKVKGKGKQANTPQGKPRISKEAKCKRCPWLRECIQRLGDEYIGITGYCR